MDRFEKLLSCIDKSMSVFEIGPSYNPVAPKTQGWRARTIDHASRTELVQKYQTEPAVDVSKIEDVDFIWRDGPLHESVPPELHGSFDACIASHVIEHAPDLVGFLVSVDALLKPGGILSLAVPDKRFCFDYFKPVSTTGDALQARKQRRTRHTRKTAFDHVAYMVHSGAQGGWAGRPPGEFRFCYSLSAAKEFFDRQTESEDAPYEDFHNWCFTPSSFGLLIHELTQLGQIAFSVHGQFPTTAMEFFVTLKKGGQPSLGSSDSDEKRLGLLRQTVIELREQGDLLSESGAARDAPSPAPGGEGAVSPLATPQGEILRRLEALEQQVVVLSDVAWEMRRALRPARAIWAVLLRLGRGLGLVRRPPKHPLGGS